LTRSTHSPKRLGTESATAGATDEVVRGIHAAVGRQPPDLLTGGQPLLPVEAYVAVAGASAQAKAVVLMTPSDRNGKIRPSVPLPLQPVGLRERLAGYCLPLRLRPPRCCSGRYLHSQCLFHSPGATASLPISAGRCAAAIVFSSV
jgi:hypothetical protein